MDLTDLLDVFYYLQRHNILQLSQQYKQLATFLPQVQVPQQAQAAANQVNTLRDQIIRLQVAVEPPPDWSEEKRAVLGELNIRQMIGRAGVDALTAALAQNVANPGLAANEIQRIGGQIEQASQRIAQVLQGLGALAREPTRDRSAVGGEEGSVVLGFRDGASIRRMSDLAEWSKEWDYALKTFHRLAHERSESSKVIDIRRGSVIITISATVGVIAVLAKAYERIMNGVEKWASAKKLAEETKQLALTSLSPAVADQIGKAADQEIETTVTTSIEALLDEYKWDSGADRNQLASELRVSVKSVTNFTVRGGSLELRLPQASTNQAALSHAMESQARVKEVAGRFRRIFEELDAIKQLPEGATGAESKTQGDDRKDQ